jgi:hypothetical protein
MSDDDYPLPLPDDVHRLSGQQQGQLVIRRVVVITFMSSKVRPKTKKPTAGCIRGGLCVVKLV